MIVIERHASIETYLMQNRDFYTPSQELQRAEEGAIRCCNDYKRHITK